MRGLSMLRKDIFEANLEGTDEGQVEAQDLRYLMYLSRNNAWVQAGNELYKFKIHGINEPTTRCEGEKTYYGSNYHKISNEDEQKIKLILTI